MAKSLRISSEFSQILQSKNFVKNFVIMLLVPVLFGLGLIV